MSIDRLCLLQTIRHMKTKQVDLRALRTSHGISQARLSELTGIPQYFLSAYELGKSAPTPQHLANILNVFSNIDNHAQVLTRKKRYRAHTYTDAQTQSRIRRSYSRTDENIAYLKQLALLAAEPRPFFTGVSLFSGIGGFSLGFKSLGCDIKGFVEIDDGLADIYAANFPTTERIGSDITQLKSGDITSFLKRSGPIDIVIGGPPCQGFSLSGKRDIEDPRNYLFQEYMRFIDLVQPRIAIIENVRLLTSMKSKGGGYVKDHIVRDLKRHGYRAAMYEVNACHYGVPQHRERVLFIAVRNDVSAGPSFPVPTHGNSKTLFDRSAPIRTFADACSDLKFLESGERAADPFHVAVEHPDHVIRWLWDVPQGKSAHDNADPDLRPPSGYNTTYKRQVWDEPGATVQTTFGMISGCRNVHPIATRSLTVREAARLQSFPDSYKFVGSLSTIRTGIGNAVPPLLSRAIAAHVRSTVLDLVEVSSL